VCDPATYNGLCMVPSTGWDYCAKSLADYSTCPGSNTDWTTKPKIKLVVTWANPDATCPNICYDGFAAQV